MIDVFLNTSHALAAKAKFQNNMSKSQYDGSILPYESGRRILLGKNNLPFFFFGVLFFFIVLLVKLDRQDHMNLFFMKSKWQLQ